MENQSEYEFIQQYGYIQGTGSYDIVRHIPTNTYVIGYDARNLCYFEGTCNYTTNTFATITEAKEWFDEQFKN